MKRRALLKAACGAVLAAVLPKSAPAQEPKAMKHLFSNYEGELVAADTLEQASHYHDCELGGADEPEDGWYQVADGARIPIHHEDENETETKTAAEWAAEFSEPCVAATTYW